MNEILSTIYNCQRCGYETNLKGNLKNHLKRQTVCLALNEACNIDRSQLIEELEHRDYRDECVECPYCKRKFNHRSSMYRHKPICKSKKQARQITTSPDQPNPPYQVLSHVAPEMLERIKNEVLLEIRQELEDKNENKDNINQDQETQESVVQNQAQEQSDQSRQITALQNTIKDLEIAVRIAKEDKRENTYQRLLEKFCFPGATHVKNACGVTDITTDMVHAEIKRFDCWKESIGQLLAYHTVMPRSELHAYLFGKYSTACKNTAVSVLHRLHIHPFEIKLEDGQFVVLDLIRQDVRTFDLQDRETEPVRETSDSSLRN